MSNKIRQNLSTLWIFLVANYLYCDVLTLMDPRFAKLLAGDGIPGLAVDDLFLLVAGGVMEIPIAMIVLSRNLPDRANRWTNFVAGIAMVGVQFGSFSMGPSPTLHYWFFSGIEIATAGWISWSAWIWDPTPTSPDTVHPCRIGTRA